MYALRLVGDVNCVNDFNKDFILRSFYFYTDEKVYSIDGMYDFKEIKKSELTTKITINTNHKLKEYELEKFQHIPEIKIMLRYKKLRRVKNKR